MDYNVDIEATSVWINIFYNYQSEISENNKIFFKYAKIEIGSELKDQKWNTHIG